MVLNTRVLNSEFSVVKCLPELLEQEVACLSLVLESLPSRHVQMYPVQGMGERALEPLSTQTAKIRKVALDLERTGQLRRP